MGPALGMEVGMWVPQEGCMRSPRRHPSVTPHSTPPTTPPHPITPLHPPSHFTHHPISAIIPLPPPSHPPSHHPITPPTIPQVCGADLSALCAVWSDLNPDFLVYGCLLFVIAETMFLGEWHGDDGWVVVLAWSRYRVVCCLVSGVGARSGRLCFIA